MDTKSETKLRQKLLFKLNPRFDELKKLYTKYHNNIKKWYEAEK